MFPIYPVLGAPVSGVAVDYGLPLQHVARDSANAQKVDTGRNIPPDGSAGKDTVHVERKGGRKPPFFWRGQCGQRADGLL